MATIFEVLGVQQGGSIKAIPVDTGYNDAAVIAPGAGVIANAPCDAVTVTADAVCTVVLVSGAAWSGTLLKGYIYPFRCNKITAVGAGALTALWH